MWSAAVDPRVIAARACRIGPDGGRSFDGAAAAVRALRGQHEHLLVDRDGIITRLDIVDGTALAGPVSLHFDLPDDSRLETRIGAIRAFLTTGSSSPRNVQFARRVHALHAVDARDAGANLRDIADLVLGPGNWPGDGEHRKSLVRRMIAAGDRMIAGGVRPVLAGR